MWDGRLDPKRLEMQNFVWQEEGLKRKHLRRYLQAHLSLVFVADLDIESTTCPRDVSNYSLRDMDEGGSRSTLCYGPPPLL